MIFTIMKKKLNIKQFLVSLILISLPFITISQTLNDSLLIYYPFSGNANDLSSNGFNGTVNASLTTDRFGNPNSAYSFDGINDYIDLPYSLKLKPAYPFSISFWLKLNTLPNTSNGFFCSDTEIGDWNGCWMTISAHNNWQVEINLGGGLGSTSPGNRRSKLSSYSLTTNVWYNILGIVRGATDMDIYINCEYFGGTYSGYGPTSISYTSFHGSIGRTVAGNPSFDYYYFKGCLDEFRFWNRELNANDISILCAITEINDLEKEYNIISVYPNPAQNQIYINTLDKKYEKTIIYNTIGEVVKNMSFANNVDISNLPNGLFIVKLICKNRVSQTVKFIKQ